MVKSLVLDTAAAFAAMGGGLLLYGAGFCYIPGTDTCIKMSGYLRVDTTFNGASTAIRSGTAAAPATGSLIA